MPDYRSSFAVDLNDIDQNISGTTSVKLLAQRALWDLNSDFDLVNSNFVVPTDGIWNGNGTITCKEILNCTRISIEIWRNDELWFTVAQKSIQVAETEVAFPYSCDMDCYYTEGHVFDLRIRLEGILPSCVVSGVQEDTAWGASFIFPLYQSSPT